MQNCLNAGDIFGKFAVLRESYHLTISRDNSLFL